MSKPNFDDFNLVKSSIELLEDEKTFKLTKYYPEYHRDEDGNLVTTFKIDKIKYFHMNDIDSIIFGPA